MRALVVHLCLCCFGSDPPDGCVKMTHSVDGVFPESVWQLSLQSIMNIHNLLVINRLESFAKVLGKW